MVRARGGLLLRQHGIASTIPEREDQIAHRHKRRGRPIDLGDQQRVRYRDRKAVDWGFNKLQQWCGSAMRSDKTAWNYHAELCLAATLDWLSSGVTAQPVIDSGRHARQIGPAELSHQSVALRAASLRAEASRLIQGRSATFAPQSRLNV